MGIEDLVLTSKGGAEQDVYNNGALCTKCRKGIDDNTLVELQRLIIIWHILNDKQGDLCNKDNELTGHH